MKVFLDLGAWNGNSVTHFRAARPDAIDFNVYCFECHPVTIKRLRKNIPDAEIIKKAVWIEDCEKILRCGTGRFIESSSIVKSKKVKGHAVENDCVVDCIDFSKWVKENLKIEDYNVAKFNIEGAEYKVIEKLCLDGTVNYFKELYIEWHWKKMEMSEEEHRKYLSMIPASIKLKTWELDHTKKAVYTVITGNNKYSLKEPTRVAVGWDYICFTDLDPVTINTDLPLKESIWEIKHPGGSHSDGRKFSRQIKILHDQYLPGYNLSLYHDSKFRTGINIDRFVKQYLKHDIAVMEHNRRNCLYKEAEYFNSLPIADKQTKKDIDRQVEFYKQQGMPQNSGLFAPGIMIRRHGVESLRQMMHTWYQQTALYSHRDQISFPYAYWKHKNRIGRIDLMPFNETCESFLR